jgi:hypothetical protein
MIQSPDNCCPAEQQLLTKSSSLSNCIHSPQMFSLMIHTSTKDSNS